MDDARRALRPFERVIVFLGGLVLVGIVLQIGYFASGQSSFLGFGSSDVCVSVSPWSSETFPGVGHVRVNGLADGARASVHTVNLCQPDPTTGERILYSLDQGVLLLFGAGLMFLLWRLLRQARLHGVFVEAFARRVSGLGLFVLLGTAAVVVIRSWAGWELQKALIPDGSQQAQWGVPFTPLIVGLGLITLGRLMAVTVPMREELDATV